MVVDPETGIKKNNRIAVVLVSVLVWTVIPSNFRRRDLTD
jgi:hypothetical protein